MAKAPQPYLHFTIEGSEVNLDSSKIFPIDSMLTNNGQKSAMILKFKHIYYMKLHDFCNHKY